MVLIIIMIIIFDKWEKHLLSLRLFSFNLGLYDEWKTISLSFLIQLFNQGSLNLRTLIEFAYILMKVKASYYCH